MTVTVCMTVSIPFSNRACIFGKNYHKLASTIKLYPQVLYFESQFVICDCILVSVFLPKVNAFKQYTKM